MIESTPHARRRQRPSPACRRPPALHVVIPLEQPGKILFDAETFEDELRLRSWLRRSSAFEALPGILTRLLDDLDEHDTKAAA